jgi:hypothetical protein
MTAPVDQRLTAILEGDFVVLLIGMRINRPWKVRHWLPVLLAMRRMLRELAARPESGFLGHTFGWPVIVQYWRSFEHLEAYARGRDGRHWPAWVAFNRRTGRQRGAVGIWHETYRVRAGEYEAIYSGMPAHGLGRVGRLAPVSGPAESARGRLAPAHLELAGQRVGLPPGQQGRPAGASVDRRGQAGQLGHGAPAAPVQARRGQAQDDPGALHAGGQGFESPHLHPGGLLQSS